MSAMTSMRTMVLKSLNWCNKDIITADKLKRDTLNENLTKSQVF